VPDGTFNGVEVLWIAAILVLCCVVAYARYKVRYYARLERRLRERGAPRMSQDEILATTFQGEADWPRKDAA
jgi:hypothetical protein